MFQSYTKMYLKSSKLKIYALFFNDVMKVLAFLLVSDVIKAYAQAEKAIQQD